MSIQQSKNTQGSELPLKYQMYQTPERDCCQWVMVGVWTLGTSGISVLILSPAVFIHTAQCESFRRWKEETFNGGNIRRDSFYARRLEIILSIHSHISYPWEVAMAGPGPQRSRANKKFLAWTQRDRGGVWHLLTIAIMLGSFLSVGETLSCLSLSTSIICGNSSLGSLMQESAKTVFTLVSLVV